MYIGIKDAPALYYNKEKKGLMDCANENGTIKIIVPRKVNLKKKETKTLFFDYSFSFDSSKWKGCIAREPTIFSFLDFPGWSLVGFSLESRKNIEVLIRNANPYDICLEEGTLLGNAYFFEKAVVEIYEPPRAL